MTTIETNTTPMTNPTHTEILSLDIYKEPYIQFHIKYYKTTPVYEFNIKT